MTPRTLLVLALVASCLVVVFGTNRYTGSDPHGMLLASEAVLTHGTLRVDHLGPSALTRYGHAFHEVNGHLQLYFPLGTSLLGIPFVALARGLGLDVATTESSLQLAIAALLSALNLLLLYRLAALFLEPRHAVPAATVTWFGTSLASTLGTALWSHNGATLAATCAVYLAVRAGRRQQPPPWHALALTLFFAYLCRPTLALLAPCLLLYLSTFSRPAALKTGLGLLACLGAFVAYSLHAFHQPLPGYYLPGRLGGGPFLLALGGNLLSPARGLLVFSPFLPAAWLLFGRSRPSTDAGRAWLLLGAAWPVLHLLAISTFLHWWGGYCYGPRLMTDVLPGLFLLLVHAWPTSLATRPDQVRGAAFAVTCAFSIFVHTGQGLFNPSTLAWNGEPSIDRYPEYLFDWRHPQFLASRQSLAERQRLHAARTRGVLAAGTWVKHDATDVTFPGWSDPEPSHRWTNARACDISFSVADRSAFRGTLTLTARPLGTQRLSLSLNGQPFYSGVLADGASELEVGFPPGLLVEGNNRLTFELPDAHAPGGGDTRLLGLALESFVLR